jgi:hypothetical protein
VCQRGQGGGACAALKTGYRDMIGSRLGYAGRNCSDADLGDQLYRYARGRVDVLEVVDQLRQILDGVDIVMRRG